MLFTYTKEESTRFEKWVSLSHKMSQVGFEYLMIYIQDLGRMDIELMRRDESILKTGKLLESKPDLIIRHSLYLQESQALARFWTLGAYELMRIIKDSNPKVANIRSIYEIYRRIRIPLAKLEAATGYKEDQKFAQLVLDSTRGIAWAVHESFIISRHELSDKFLSI
jgi:hypothetical protein